MTEYPHGEQHDGGAAKRGGPAAPGSLTAADTSSWVQPSQREDGLFGDPFEQPRDSAR